MGRQVGGKYVYRQVDRHARIYIARFKLADGWVQKQVYLIVTRLFTLSDYS